MQILVLINEYELWTLLQAMYLVLDQISFISSLRWISSEQITTNQTKNIWKQVEDNTRKLDHFNYFLANEYITHPAEVTIIMISISDYICHMVASLILCLITSMDQNGSKSQKKYFQISMHIITVEFIKFS